MSDPTAPTAAGHDPDDPAGPPPGSLSAVRERARAVRPPNRSAEYDARRRLPDVLLPTVHFVDVADVAVWWAGVRGVCPAPAYSAAAVVVLAADHAIAARGVSALPLGWTATAATALREPQGTLAAAAEVAGAAVEVLDVDVAGPQGPTGMPFDVAEALDGERLDDAVARGMAIATRLGQDGGHDAIGLSAIGVGATTTAATLAGAVLGLGVLDVVTRGSGIDDLAWMRKAAAVRDGLRRGRRAGLGPASAAADHLRHLGAVDIAVAVGLLVEAAARRIPVVLDGPVVAVAALLAQRICPNARHWWLGVEGRGDTIASRVWDEIGVARVTVGVEGAGLGACQGLAAVRTAAAVLACPTPQEMAHPQAPPEPTSPDPTDDATDDATTEGAHPTVDHPAAPDGVARSTAGTAPTGNDAPVADSP